MEFQINFRKILDALVSKFYIVLITAAVFFIGGVLTTDANAPDTYSATTTIYSASYVSYRDSLEARNAILFYADVLRSRKVAERAASFIPQDITPEQIMSMVSSSSTGNSAVFSVSAVSRNPETAVSVVNAVAAAFVQEVVYVTAMEGVKVLDQATRAYLYSSGSRSAMVTRAEAALVGAGLSILIIACFAALDKRAAFPHEVTLSGEIELIGSIPEKGI